MATIDIFEQHRGRMFGIAYRMLGSATEADDIVQEAWLRWQADDRSDVAEPAAFLATIVTRLCLTELDSARARRETYVGPWLPEPVDSSQDPTLGAERAEVLSLAVLLLLERLTPAERAAYVLHEAFDYPFRQIAELLETSEANARQLGSRARAHIERERAAVVVGIERERLLGLFLAAAREGDLASLEAALADDVLSLADGGGFATAARKPILGRGRVAQFVLGVIDKFGRDIVTVPVEANAEPAVLAIKNGRPFALWTFEIGNDGVRKILTIMNPHKLGRFDALALSHS